MTLRGQPLSGVYDPRTKANSGRSSEDNSVPMWDFGVPTPWLDCFCQRDRVPSGLRGKSSEIVARNVDVCFQSKLVTTKPALTALFSLSETGRLPGLRKFFRCLPA